MNRALLLLPLSFLVACSTPPQAAPQEARRAGLPEPVLTCATDADCVVTGARQLTEANQCCQGCAPVVGNTAWLTSLNEVCLRIGTEGCKPRRCAPLPPVHCDNGQCTATTTAAPPGR